MDDAVWTPTTFTKNRERLLAGDIARQFFAAVLAQARGRRLLSDEHFTVDGTLLEAWAGQKSFKRKDGTSPGPSDDDPGNPTVNFHGERRTNDTHQSTTDPDSRLAKKTRGSEAKLAYLGEVLMENRHGLVVDACVVHATGTGERDGGARLARGPAAARGDRRRRQGLRHARLGGDARDSSASRRTSRRSSAARSMGARRGIPGYAVSQRMRKRIEEIFGWMKTVGGLRKLRHRGGDRVDWQFLFVAAAYNLVRLRNLPAEAA